MGWQPYQTPFSFIKKKQIAVWATTAVHLLHNSPWGSCSSVYLEKQKKNMMIEIESKKPPLNHELDCKINILSGT